ncbi:hypothetical protein AV521_18815 [Streptomyces sp. IMTB 2501]|nr:hypothetical protein AV521_18815 [Streptomyces sp. IMTB 2501]
MPVRWDGGETRVQLADADWEFIGPSLPVGRFGPYPERLRERFGARQTVYNDFMQGRDAGAFQGLPGEAITEATRRDEIDMSLGSVDSATTRAHHDATGLRASEETLAALE